MYIFEKRVSKKEHDYFRVVFSRPVGHMDMPVEEFYAHHDFTENFMRFGKYCRRNVSKIVYYYMGNV